MNKFIEFCNKYEMTIADVQLLVNKSYNNTAHVVCSFARDSERGRSDWLDPQLERYHHIQRVKVKIGNKSLWESLTDIELITLKSLVISSNTEEVLTF